MKIHDVLNRSTKLDAVEQQPSVNNFIKKFAPWVAEQLGIKLPKIELLDKPIDTTFGQYNPETKSIAHAPPERHPHYDTLTPHTYTAVYRHRMGLTVYSFADSPSCVI